MVQTLITALAAGLSLWQSKEKRKFVERLMDLKRDFYAEYNKPPSERSDSALDHIERELRILAEAFAAGVGAENAPNQP